MSDTLIGHATRRGALLVHVLDERRGRRFVGVVARRRAIASCSAVRTASSSRRSSPMRGARCDERAAYSPCQKGIRAGAPGAGVTIDAIVLDRVDAPRRRAELKHVADARFVNELLVELAESRAVGKVDGVEAAVGNRAAGDHGDHARAARRR